MKKIKLTKIKELPNAEFPNNISEGEWRIGIMEVPPSIGCSFALTFVSERNGIKTNNPGAYFITSAVTELIDSDIFKTQNSIYQIEIINSKVTIDTLFN